MVNSFEEQSLTGYYGDKVICFFFMCAGVNFMAGLYEEMYS